MIVIADTSPIRYLVLIGEVDTLVRLFGKILVPHAVAWELSQNETPEQVRLWMAKPPAWIERRRATTSLTDLPENLGYGEREAIALATELSADALLVDDWAARRAAESRRIPTLGTLGILEMADEAGMLDSREAIERLLRTNFRAGHQLIKAILDRRDARGNRG